MKNKLELYIGPCVIESRELAMEIASTVKRDLEVFGDEIKLTFKGSFDKANRSSLKSKRGLGMDQGLEILSDVKKEFGLPVITDFHLPSQAEEVAKVVDVLQIPAFLCRQTDMILAGAEAASKYGRELKIKKGQFLSPEETKNIIDKAKEHLPVEKILITERGTSFGYNNLIVDMASFEIIKSFGVRAIYDATHSIQRPGGLGSSTGGKKEQMLTLAKAAVAAGASGVFMEVHPQPDQSWSDPTTCQSLDSVKGIVETLLKIYRNV